MGRLKELRKYMNDLLKPAKEKGQVGQAACRVWDVRGGCMIKTVRGDITKIGRAHV